MKRESIQAIKGQLQTIQDRQDLRLQQWRQDERAGVKTALQQWERMMQTQEHKQQLFLEMSKFERHLYQQNYRLIAGIDEVGRGPLAGPVVAAAVILPENFQLLGLNDSKKLSEVQRKEMYAQIVDEAVAIGLGVVSNEIIDEINIYEATKLAMKQAIHDLAFAPEYLLIDAMKLDVAIPQENLIKGDARSISIAAASIVAKVTRDALMQAYAIRFPGYGFEKNMGYGTKEHLAGLNKLGKTAIHRESFAPVKNL